MYLGLLSGNSSTNPSNESIVSSTSCCLISLVSLSISSFGALKLVLVQFSLGIGYSHTY